jgi:hypothetical protein
MVMIPVRAEPGFGSTEYVTVPLPLPAGPDVMSIHGTLALTGQTKPNGAKTLTLPGPPPDGKNSLEGEIENVLHQPKRFDGLSPARLK